ncbi:MAG: YIP1 family protein [Candidatus Aenigmarchaeota archaeon]|nr:YIP1 family protein [Candidatus Aenigmarchaeota archaeon]
MATFSLLERIKTVLTNPEKFFNSVKREEALGQPVKYLIITSLVSTIASIILINIAADMVSYNPTYQMFLGGMGAMAIVLLWILGILLSFVGAAVMHVFVYLFGGRNGYTETYKATAYGSTAKNLFGWVPYIGFLAGLYSLYLTIKGLSVLQNISMGRAAAVILVPLLLALIIGFIIAGAAVLTYLVALAGMEAAA